MKGFAIVVGILLLLPGICVLLATLELIFSLSVVFWLMGLAIGLGVIMLIYIAVGE